MAMGIAAVAVAFSVLVVLLMLVDYRLRLNKDPLESAPYTALKRNWPRSLATRISSGRSA